MHVQWQNEVNLGPLTTLHIGGKAQDFWALESIQQWPEISYQLFPGENLSWHRLSPVKPTSQIPYYILGHGSNVLINSQGLPGKVIQVKNRGIELRPGSSHLDLRIQAGESWPAIVEFSVQEKLHGLETLAGIPSSAGAAAVQNIGAYGSDLASVVTGVEYYDLALHNIGFLTAAQCQFTYRGSIFKHRPHWVVTYINLRLVPQTEPVPIFYHDLEKELGSEATVGEIYQKVLEIRQRKGMLYDEKDPLTYTTGSFFVNPILAPVEKERLQEQWGDQLKFYPHGDQWKVSAARLIELAGFAKGQRQGKVGLSPHHTLAIVNYDHATSDDVKNFAQQIQMAVQEKFKIPLLPETVFFD